MNKNEKTKEKSCIFYVSNYHFEMISLPYISKKIDEGKKIIILTDENLEETIKVLVEKINLNEKKKEQILKINWNKEDSKKLQEIKEEKEVEIELLIKGTEEYINKMNKEIEEVNNKNIKVIDCYNIEKVNEKVDSIMIRYNNLISTIGEKSV